MDLAHTPLLVSTDEEVVADVLRLGAAAGVTPEIERDPAGALRRWSRAGIVLVDAAAAAELALLAPPRRDRVHVVASGPVPEGVFREALLLGAETVRSLAADHGEVVELLADAAEAQDAGPALTVGVVSGTSGAGATVFACALAQAAARRRAGRVLLADTDPWGVGVERVLGMEHRDGVRWDDLRDTRGRLGGRALRSSLPRQDGLSVLAWPSADRTPVAAGALREVLAAARRGFDVVVVDLPRHRDPTVEETLSRCDVVVLVTTATVAGVAAAARSARALARSRPQSYLLARGHGVPAEEAERLVGLPLLAAMRSQRGLDESLDLGAGPLRRRRGPLARTARSVADVLLDGRAS